MMHAKTQINVFLALTAASLIRHKDISTGKYTAKEQTKQMQNAKSCNPL